METDRSSFCGCKGIRTCLLCEQKFGMEEKNFDSEEPAVVLSYCHECGKCHQGRNESGRLDAIPCTGDGLLIPGIFILPDFISPEEENELVDNLDKIPWSLSQSGRRKQNFGPKCNFKKRKLKLGDFKGFPRCSKFVQERFEDVELLKGFLTVEQCSLEYEDKRGSSIEAHVDDCWVWGERIVTVNLISDSVLSLRPQLDLSKYNLDCVERYSSAGRNPWSASPNTLLRIPMPRRSLLVLYGEVRYIWHHLIYRKDVAGRRVCLAYREFTPPYLPGGEHHHLSRDILQAATQFF